MIVFLNCTRGLETLCRGNSSLRSSVLKAKWYKRTLAFLTHSAMIYLFIAEIVRWKKDNFGNKARPCYSEKHFSECDCNTCKKQVSESNQSTFTKF
jgi:hypothetical protein